MVGIACGDESAKAACKANGQTPVNEAAGNAADSSSVNYLSPSVSTVADPSNQEQLQAKPLAPKPR